MQHPIRATALGLALTTLAAPLAAATLSFTAGTADDFALPAEAANPSAALLGSLAGFVEFFGVAGFDVAGGINGGAADRQVAHTFTLGALPGPITAASLTLKVRAGSDTFSVSDGIALSFIAQASADYVGSLAYARALGGGNGGGSVLFSAADPGLLQTSAWNAGDEVEFTLDLAALPLVGGGTLDLLPLLNANGFLDVNLSDDTAVDFMRLDVTAVPLPGAFALLLPALGLLPRRRADVMPPEETRLP